MNQSKKLRTFFTVRKIECACVPMGHENNGRTPYVVTLAQYDGCYAIVTWLTPEEKRNAFFNAFCYITAIARPFAISPNIAYFLSQIAECDSEHAVDMYETGRRAYTDLHEFLMHEEFMELCDLVHR